MTGSRSANVDMKEAFRAASKCTAFSLRKADRVIAQLYDEALRPAGLRSTQFSLLAMILQMEPVGFKQLASVLAMDRTTLTRNLHPLEREGLLRIRPGADRRVREVSLSPKGRRRFAKAFPLWEGAQDRLEKALGRGRARDLAAQMSRVVTTLGPTS